MRLLRILTVTVGLGGFGIAAGGASCNPVSDFQCSTDEDCLGEGEGGVCESNNFCTFPDPECPTGKRWHDRASSLAGMCFGENAGTATDTDDPTMGDSSGTTSEPDPTTGVEPTTGGGSTTTGSPTTGDPLTTGDPPTTGDPMTTGGSSSSTGAAATCDEMYGGATDYMLCEELDESCRFNVTIGMASSCTMVCEAFGGMCVGAQLNQDDLCASTGDTTCDDMGVNDLICNCSR